MRWSVAADPEAEAWAGVETLFLAAEVQLDSAARVMGLLAVAIRHLTAGGITFGTEDLLVGDLATLALRLRQLQQRLARAVECAREG